MSPGLVVMGAESCSKGLGFESWHHILDGHFFTLTCCKNCIVCLKRPKINEKRPGSIFKKDKTQKIVRKGELRTNEIEPNAV